jgi:hypothetical protein
MERILTGSGNPTSRNMARFKALFPINFVAFIVMAILGLQTDFSQRLGATDVCCGVSHFNRYRRLGFQAGYARYRLGQNVIGIRFWGDRIRND